MSCRKENPDLRNINGWGYCCNHLSISRYIHECKNMKIKKWQRKLMYLEIMYSYASSFKDVTLMFRREFFLLASTTYQLFNSLRRLCNWIICEIYTYYQKYTHYQKSNIRTNLYNQKTWFYKDSAMKNVYHKWIWKYFWNFYVLWKYWIITRCLAVCEPFWEPYRYVCIVTCCSLRPITLTGNCGKYVLDSNK